MASAVAVGLSFLALVVSALAAPPSTAAEFLADLAPEVTHTGTAPTGYTVTFRYYAPDAERVQIKGEWFFERPSELNPNVGTAESPTVPTPGILPPAWQPGDVPIAYPNSSAANWPVVDLVQDASTGIWSYTTPLPSGVFTYGFFLDCPSDTGAGCPQQSDPSNLPWNQTAGDVTGSTQASSQVYVPSDPAFGTTDNSWSGPAETPGTLTSITYPSPGHVSPAESNYAVVYTPPGYDPARSAPYPTLYLAHGGGGNETDWTTQGAAGDIMDNLIAAGQVRPTVVVMTNNGGFPSSTFNDAYDQDMIKNLIPFVESNYGVSTSAEDRAFAGLSAGGIIANSFMIKYPDTFGHYNQMSAGLPPAYATLTPEQARGLQDKSITISSGRQDPIWAGGFGTNHEGGRKQAITFAAASLGFTTTLVDGGHEWYVWRLLLRDFLVGSELFAGETAPSGTPAPPTASPSPLLGIPSPTPAAPARGKLLGRIATKMAKPVEVATKVRLRVTVQAGGVVPSGAIRIRVKGAGKERSYTRTLDARGRARVWLPRFKRTGTVTVAVRYHGDGDVRATRKTVAFAVVDRHRDR